MSNSYLVDFRRPQTANQLAAYIGIDNVNYFDRVISSDSRSEFYIRHQIPKRSRHRLSSFRTVWEAGPLLLAAHKAVARRF